MRVLQGSQTWRGRRDTDTVTARLVPIAGSPTPIDTDDAVRQVETLRISFSTVFYGHPEFSNNLLDTFETLLGEKRMQPARVKLIDGGYEGIMDGLEELRSGLSIGGYKLVVRLENS